MDELLRHYGKRVVFKKNCADNIYWIDGITSANHLNEQKMGSL
jgi:hypothetical protein